MRDGPVKKGVRVPWVWFELNMEFGLVTLVCGVVN